VLKLKRDEPLSNFAFKFNLRRYSTLSESKHAELESAKVGRCRLTLSNPH
jgi:hypothetical protein